MQELKKAKFEPVIVSLLIFLIFGSIKNVTNPHVTSFLFVYEKMLERLFHILRIQIQNPIIYLVVPPICIAAYKLESRTVFKESDN